jgi:hypothetical protein
MTVSATRLALLVIARTPFPRLRKIEERSEGRKVFSRLAQKSADISAQIEQHKFLLEGNCAGHGTSDCLSDSMMQLLNLVF